METVSSVSFSAKSALARVVKFRSALVAFLVMLMATVSSAGTFDQAQTDITAMVDEGKVIVIAVGVAILGIVAAVAIFRFVRGGLH